MTQEGRALVIAVNKWDLVEDKQTHAQGAARDAWRSACRRCRAWRSCRYRRCRGRGLDRLAKAVLDAYDTWNRRVSTADLNRWLEEALSAGMRRPR